MRKTTWAHTVFSRPTSLSFSQLTLFKVIRAPSVFIIPPGVGQGGGGGPGGGGGGGGTGPGAHGGPGGGIVGGVLGAVSVIWQLDEC